MTDHLRIAENFDGYLETIDIDTPSESTRYGIEITDPPEELEVHRRQGSFLNYYAYDGDQQVALANQRHVDVRVFEFQPVTTTPTMLHFDMFTMDELNSYIMSDLIDQVAVRRDEEWSVGTVEKASDRNNWKHLSLTCPSGQLTVTESVIPKF